MLRFLSALCVVLCLAAPAFADCTTPAGYTRWGSSNWRFSEQMPGAASWAERLPANVPIDISADIKAIGKRSAGVVIHIRSNTSTLRVCWQNQVTSPSEPIWSQTGASGISVQFRPYGSTDEFQFLDVGEAVDPNNNADSFVLGSSADREFKIYMPSNRRVDLLRIEQPTGYTMSPGPAPTLDPIVVLGTSIVQGVGSSRPDIPYPQALGRHYNADAINLGFAGSCQLPVGMATLLGTIDASVFVIDCFPNMTTAQITAQLGPFLDTLLPLIPATTPVEIVQDRLNLAGGPHPDFIARQAANLAAMTPILAARTPTHPNLHFIPADDLLPSAKQVIDGSHPNDFGYDNEASVIEAAIGPLP